MDEQYWFDEWWIIWGNGRFCDSQYRTEYEANENLIALKFKFPDTKMWVEHIHIEDGHTPFSEHIRPAGMLMWPIDHSELIK